MDSNILYMFVDGACVPNPGFGGYAYLLDFNGNRKINSGVIEGESTNQRAEITSAIEAFKALKPNGRKLKIVVTSDSQYLINIMKREWRMKSNGDLFAELFTLSDAHDVQWEWVKGHAGHPQNEIVDGLANSQAEKAFRESQR